MARLDIADVSRFVMSDTPMDNEAAARGTTVYLVDKRIDMLPELLGTNLCSLRPHVERLAFSVIWVCSYLLSDISFLTMFRIHVGTVSRSRNRQRPIYEICHCLEGGLHL